MCWDMLKCTNIYALIHIRTVICVSAENITGCILLLHLSPMDEWFQSSRMCLVVSCMPHQLMFICQFQESIGGKEP